MPTDLNLDNDIDEVKNLGANATGWATKVEALLNKAFKANLNPFGSAATKDIATGTGAGASGKLPPIGSDGRIDSDYINTPQGFIDSDNIVDRSIPAVKIRRGDMTGEEMEDLTIGHRKINASGTNSSGDPLAPKYLLGYDSANRKFGWTAPQEIPIGEIKILSYKISPIPTGWIECDGRSISRTTYSELFSKIGTTYGNVDNDNFNIPDFKNKTIVAKGTSDLTSKIGKSGGSETITMTKDNLPEHDHNCVTGDPLPAGGTLGSQNPYIKYKEESYNDRFDYWLAGSNRVPNIGPTSLTGNSSPISLMQPYIVMFAMIYAGQ